MERHRLAEERSLEAHRHVAERLRREPALAVDARARLQRWVASGAVSPFYAKRWAAVLDGAFEDLLELLVSDSEDARAMRQVSPFAGVLSPRERWKIWREVAARTETVAR